MTLMTKASIAYTTVIGILMSIPLVSVSVFSQEGEINLTEFRDLLSNTTYNKEWPNVHPNVLSDFSDRVVMPKINETAFLLQWLLATATLDRWYTWPLLLFVEGMRECP